MVCGVVGEVIVFCRSRSAVLCHADFFFTGENVLAVLLNFLHSFIYISFNIKLALDIN